MNPVPGTTRPCGPNCACSPCACTPAAVETTNCSCCAACGSGSSCGCAR